VLVNRTTNNGDRIRKYSETKSKKENSTTIKQRCEKIEKDAVDRK
jgi:hypothetical protein